MNYCKSRLKNTKTFQYVFPCWFLFVAKSSSNHGAHELFVQINSKKGRCCQQANNTLDSLIHSLWNLNHVFCQSPYSLWKGKYSTHWYHCCPQIVQKTHVKSIMINLLLLQEWLSCDTLHSLKINYGARVIIGSKSTMTSWSMLYHMRFEAQRQSCKPNFKFKGWWDCWWD